MLKKILISFAVLVVLLGGGLYYAWSNIDGLIKAAVDKYGSEATQAAVHLGNVQLSLTSGEGALYDLSVGNPKGFSAGKALSLGEIGVSLDTASLPGTGPIVLRKIVIAKPQITYEMADDGSSNLQALARNVQTYAASLTSGGKPTAQTPTAASATTPAPAKSADAKAERKIIINDLIVSDGQIGISQVSLAKFAGKPLTATLPTIHLTNIGKASGGATAAQVAEQILGAITNAASNVARDQLAGQLTNKLKDALGKAALEKGALGGLVKDGLAKGAPQDVTKKLKGLLGQ